MRIKRTLSFALSALSCISGLVQAQETVKPTTLDEIFAPYIVGVPPSDAYIGLSKMPDGELRHYNYGEQVVSSHPMYLSSRDNGFTWKSVNLSEAMIPYGDNYSPVSGEYIRAFHTNNSTYVMRTVGGLEGGRTITLIDSTLSIMLKPPVFVDGGKRVIIAGHGVNRDGCFTYVSTDDGLSWTRSNKVNSPLHERGGFHAGIRWNHGAVEPTVAEIGDGRLWMIMRTARDHHYQSFSEDGGLTWSEPRVSPFYGTITMPTFQKLEDGRLLFFWSNTTPLPEMASSTGQWDDVFTNRSASHVAISEDNGTTWIGMRELILDTRRGAADFGTVAGRDKSVHQAQAVEVEPGKILVSVGQNILNRKMLLFDVDWLYEDSRESDFSNGLEDWSTFRYFKGIVGHCGYNRQDPELLVAHPDKEGERVLKIGYTPNDTLVEDRDGAVWNFPAAKSGEVTARIQLPDGAQSIDLILNDRWFNPTDSVAKYESQYKVALDRKSLKIKDAKWHDVTVRWTLNGEATIYVDGKRRSTTKLISPTIHGVSYLHLLGGTTPDEVGVLIESVRSKKIN